VGETGPTPQELLSPAVAAFVARVNRLTDDERRAIADARASVDESFHRSALRAAAEQLVGHGEEYARARSALATAHVPDHESTCPDEAAATNAQARQVQLAIDDGLLALRTRDTLHPKHLRELTRSLAVLSDA
jgi:hypothetical protein